MRARLRESLLQCCVGSNGYQLPKVEEVCREAGTSRVTFYAYFDSIEALVEDCATASLDEMVRELEDLFVQESPLRRIIFAIQLFLIRAATDKAWAFFVSRVVHVDPQTIFGQAVAQDLRQSIDMGEIVTDDVDAAMSVALGAMFEAIRHIYQSDERRRVYVDSVELMILLALGVERQRGVVFIECQRKELIVKQPAGITWWQDPWM